MNPSQTQLNEIQLFYLNLDDTSTTNKSNEIDQLFDSLSVNVLSFEGFKQCFEEIEERTEERIFVVLSNCSDQSSLAKLEQFEQVEMILVVDQQLSSINKIRRFNATAELAHFLRRFCRINDSQPDSCSVVIETFDSTADFFDKNIEILW